MHKTPDLERFLALLLAGGTLWFVALTIILNWR